MTFFPELSGVCLDAIADFYDISSEEMDYLNKKRLIPFARIKSTHGLKGDLKIKSLLYSTSVDELIGKDSNVYLSCGNEFFVSNLHGVVKDKGIILLKDENDFIQNNKNFFLNKLLCVEASKLINSNFPYLLMGFRVFKENFNTIDSFVGFVVGIYNFGAGDLIEIMKKGIDDSIFIPFGCVLKVDHENYSLCVDSEIIDVQS